MAMIYVKPLQPQPSKDRFRALMEHKRAMLRRPTRGERRFRAALKQLGVAFKAQRLFIDAGADKGYIADFYLEDLKLVFEVDGKSHDGPFAKDYDAVRTSLLSRRGIKVARIRNEDTADAAGCVAWAREQIAERGAEMARKIAERRAAKRDPREMLSTPQEERDRMVKEFLAAGGVVTKCPTVAAKGRRFTRGK